MTTIDRPRIIVALIDTDEIQSNDAELFATHARRLGWDATAEDVEFIEAADVDTEIAANGANHRCQTAAEWAGKPKEWVPVVVLSWEDVL